MASDGKGKRKHHAALCPKCSDSGHIFEYKRVRGRWVITGKFLPCPKNCPASKTWKKEHP